MAKIFFAVVVFSGSYIFLAWIHKPSHLLRSFFYGVLDKIPGFQMNLFDTHLYAEAFLLASVVFILCEFYFSIKERDKK